MSEGVRKHRRSRLLFVGAAALCVVFLAFLATGAAALSPLPDVFDSGKTIMWSRGVFEVAAAPLVTLWGFSACRRCTDRFVRRCLAGVCALCLFWILDTLVKYPCQIDELVRLLWYLFYIPILFIPLLCSYIALHFWKGEQNGAWRRFRGIMFGVSLALLLLVLTNGSHHFVFSFDYDDPSWGSAYEYEPGYWIIVAWIAFQGLLCPIALISVVRRDLRRAVAFLMVPLGLIGAYALLYALRVPVVFSTSVAMADTVFVVATFEMALRLGLIPSSSRQLEIFRRLPFELEVVDDAHELCYRTDAAAANVHFGKPEAHVSYTVEPLSTGYSILSKDTALVDRQKRELETAHHELVRQSEILEAEYGIDQRIRVQEGLKRLYDEVAEPIGGAIACIVALMDEMPDEDSDEHKRERRFILSEVKLLLAQCKQKGTCIIDAGSQTVFSGDYLTLGFAETSATMRSLGMECAVLNEASALSAAQLCLVYDEVYAWACSVLDHAEPAVLVRVFEESDALQLRIMVECDDARAAVRRRHELQNALGTSLAETIWVPDEHSISAVVALGEEPRLGEEVRR